MSLEEFPINSTLVLTESGVKRRFAVYPGKSDASLELVGPPSHTSLAAGGEYGAYQLGLRFRCTGERDHLV